MTISYVNDIMNMSAVCNVENIMDVLTNPSQYRIHLHNHCNSFYTESTYISRLLSIQPGAQNEIHISTRCLVTSVIRAQSKALEACKAKRANQRETSGQLCGYGRMAPALEEASTRG